MRLSDRYLLEMDTRRLCRLLLSKTREHEIEWEFSSVDSLKQFSCSAYIGSMQYAIEIDMLNDKTDIYANELRLCGFNKIQKYIVKLYNDLIEINNVKAKNKNKSLDEEIQSSFLTRTRAACDELMKR